jgi:MFS transporter, NNP family, nitrate/nitrite transporter
VAAGFLLKATPSTEQGLLILGGLVIVSALCALGIRFTSEQKGEERRLFEEAMAIRRKAERPEGGLPEAAA